MFFLKRMVSFAVCAALVMMSAPAAYAATADELLRAMKAQADRLAAQEKALEESRKKLEEQQRDLLQERVKFNQMREEVSKFTGKQIEDVGAPPEIAKAAETTKPPQATATQTAGTQPKEVGTDRKEEAEKPPEIAAVIDQGGVLLGKGKLAVTPSLEYSRSSATRVSIQGFAIIPALNIGLFEITQTDRDTVTAAMGLRYGLTNRLELETRIPYVYRADATKTRPIGSPGAAETLSNVTGSDIGDVEFGLHYQMNNGQGGWPYLIGNLRYKTATGTNPYEVPLNGAGVETELPTGSGFQAIQPSITAIFPSDPVVYYANVGYLHNFEEDFGGTVGTIDPGDSINAGMGMSFSVNDRTSFSLGYSHNTVLKSKQNGAVVSNATLLQVGTLDLGYSYALNDWTSLNFGVSAGITEDAPDARVTFRVPMTFDLLK